MFCPKCGFNNPQGAFCQKCGNPLTASAPAQPPVDIPPVSNTAAPPPARSTSGGKEYKTVAGPVGLTITHKESYANAVKMYAAIIDKESIGGWKLDCIQPIPVTKKAGCLASLFGAPDVTITFNMLVFVRDR